jgi:hypothetical protein
MLLLCHRASVLTLHLSASLPRSQIFLRDVYQTTATSPSLERLCHGVTAFHTLGITVDEEMNKLLGYMPLDSMRSWLLHCQDVLDGTNALVLTPADSQNSAATSNAVDSTHPLGHAPDSETNTAPAAAAAAASAATSASTAPIIADALSQTNLDDPDDPMFDMDSSVETENARFPEALDDGSRVDRRELTRRRLQQRLQDQRSPLSMPDQTVVLTTCTHPMAKAIRQSQSDQAAGLEAMKRVLSAQPKYATEDLGLGNLPIHFAAHFGAIECAKVTVLRLDPFAAAH